jgi:transposase
VFSSGKACVSGQTTIIIMNTDLLTFQATIGLDWADKKHDLWVRPADGSKSQHVQLEHTAEAIHEWVAKLRERFPNGSVAIAVETSRGPVLSALRAYDFIVIFAVNPKCLKDYRAAFQVSGAKSDRSDAQLLEEMVRLHRDRLKALHPDDALTRKIGGLAETRRALVDQRTRLVNQAHASLKMYYPLAEKVLVDELNTVMAAEFLVRWPDLQMLLAASANQVRDFFYKHNCRSPKKLADRLEAIRKAKALTVDEGIIEPARAMVIALAGMLKSLHRSITQLDAQIQAAMDQHPDAAIFRSFPAAGPALAPRLLAAFGTQRDRFDSPTEVAQLYGIAPVKVQSGNSTVVHMRYRCSKFGRQTFHENAACAAKTEPWARNFYKERRKEPLKRHHQTCRALAFKLIRIYFRCWKDRTKYNSAIYLEALEKRQPKSADIEVNKSNENH